MATLIEMFDKGAQLAHQTRQKALAGAAAVDQYGDIARDPGAFATLTQADATRRNQARSDVELGMRRQQQDFAMQGAQQDRTRDAAIRAVNFLRSARDRGEDLGTAFDRVAPALKEIGVDPSSFPEMRQAAVDNPAILDDYYASLTGKTSAPSAAAGQGVADSPAPGETDAAAAQQAMATRQGGIVLKNLGAVMDRVENGFIPVTGGFGGSIATKIPGPARNVAARLDTIKANIGFDALQAMRAASPTGGALGQVSDTENRLLQATLGSLDQAQTKDQFLDQLLTVERVYLDIVFGEGNWRKDQNGEVIVTDEQGKTYKVNREGIAEPISAPTPAPSATSSPAAPAWAPKPGDVVPGVGTYKGGDPRKASSYEPG